jgi:hypothetical protein
VRNAKECQRDSYDVQDVHDLHLIKLIRGFFKVWGGVLAVVRSKDLGRGERRERKRKRIEKGSGWEKSGGKVRPVLPNKEATVSRAP